MTFGPEGEVPTWAYAGFALAVVLSLLAAIAPARLGPRSPFLLSLLTAAVAVALLVGRGGAIT